MGSWGLELRVYASCRVFQDGRTGNLSKTALHIAETESMILKDDNQLQKWVGHRWQDQLVAVPAYERDGDHDNSLDNSLSPG